MGCPSAPCGGTSPLRNVINLSCAVSKSLPLGGNTVNLRLKMAKRKDVEIE